jgi:hypothetical protein
MFGSGSSRRNTIAMSLAWWYLRRLIRKRGTAAVAGLVAGQGLSVARGSRKRHPFRWLLLLGLVAGGIFWWRRRQGGGGDDWGDWEPAAPVGPPPAEPAPAPVPEPVAT